MHADSTGLNRGPLTRWMPVLFQASTDPAEPQPYDVTATTTGRRYLGAVLLSAKRYTIPGALASMVEMVGLALMMPLVIGQAVDKAIGPGDYRMLYLFIGIIAVAGVVRISAARISQQLGKYASQLVQHRLRVTLSEAALHPKRLATGTATVLWSR